MPGNTFRPPCSLLPDIVQREIILEQQSLMILKLFTVIMNGIILRSMLSNFKFCIVSIHLYSAVHTNQMRFQCERPREKRAVLRERKESATNSCIFKTSSICTF